MRAELIVFDLDDTLYPERDYVAGGFRAVDRWLASNHGLAGFFEAAWSRFQAGTRGTVFDAAMADLERPCDAAFIAEMVSVYRAHEPQLTAYADALSILSVLRERHQIAVLTDGYAAVQRRKVRALDLERQVDSIVYSDELGGRAAWKPSPLPYEAVMNQFHRSGPDCVYVADNPQKDFVTAKRLGWTTVRICRDGGEHSRVEVEPAFEAALRVHTLTELPRLLPNGVSLNERL